MTKRLLSAAAVALLSASVAQAATITYTLQVDDGAAGRWGLYADVVGGGGLQAYNITLNNALLATKSQQAPKIVYTDSSGSLGDMSAGFTLFRSGTVSGADYVLTGSQDSVESAGPNLPVYGFGITAGTLNTIPAGYDGTSGAVQATYAAHLKLATGTYNTALAHSTVADWFHVGATNSNNANLFTASGNTANTIINATLAVAGVTSTTNTNTDSLSATTVGTPDVTLNVVRNGAGAYVPTVALVNGGTGLVKGTANIVGPITEAPIWVMAKIIGTDAANVIGVLPNQTATAGELADLHAKYDALFPGGSFNALFKFTSPASAGSFSWDMTGWNAQVSALAAVPEPASLGLVALGALGLLARRRK